MTEYLNSRDRSGKSFVIRVEILQKLPVFVGACNPPGTVDDPEEGTRPEVYSSWFCGDFVSTLMTLTSWLSMSTNSIWSSHLRAAPSPLSHLLRASSPPSLTLLSSSSVCWSQPGPICRGEERRVFRPAMAMTRSAFVILFVLAASLVVNTQGQVPIAPAPSPANASAPAPYYISYGALSANQAPCPSGAGQSYYSANCVPQTDVTPYTRSCIQITRCARG